MKFSIKFFLIIPIFIWFFFRIKLYFYFKKFKKNKLNLTEEERYLWVRKYSKFLSWLFFVNKKINIFFWNDKKIVSIVKTDSIYQVLNVISKNDFNYQLPIFLVINESDFLDMKPYLKKLFSLIECNFLKENNFFESLIEKFVEKIKIPRALFYFSKEVTIEHIKRLVKISKDSFSKIILLNYFNNKLIIKNTMKPEEIILLETNILSKRISIFIDE